MKKVFSFDSSYVLHAQVTATNQGSPLNALLAWPSGFGDQVSQPDYAQGQLDFMQNGKSNILAAKKVTNEETRNGPFDWGGVSCLYFGATFLPDSPSQATLVSLHNELTDSSRSQRAARQDFSGDHFRRGGRRPRGDVWSASLRRAKGDRRAELRARHRTGWQGHRAEHRTYPQLRILGICLETALPRLALDS